MRLAQEQKHSAEWHKMLTFVSLIHPHASARADPVVPLSSWCWSDDSDSSCFRCLNPAWLLCMAVSASRSPLCTVLDVCRCVSRKKQLSSLLISNCNGQCKLLVASFVTAGWYLWLSPYLKGFSGYQGGFHLLISCPKCVRYQVVRSSSVLCFFPMHTRTITAGHIVHSL